MYCDRGVSWEIRQLKVHPGIRWRFYPGRNQFLDNNYLAAPDHCGGYHFLPSTRNLRACVYDQKVFVLISPLQPRVYDQKVCILAPRTVQRERLERYQNHIDHQLPSFAHNGEIFWDKHKDGISTIIPPILFWQSFNGRIWLYPLSTSTVGDEFGCMLQRLGYGKKSTYKIHFKVQAQHTLKSKTTT